MTPLSFAFGGTGNYKSAKDLQRERDIVDALIARSNPAPRTFGEGLTAIGEAIGTRMRGKRLERDTAHAQEGASSLAKSLFGGGAASMRQPTEDAYEPDQIETTDLGGVRPSKTTGNKSSWAKLAETLSPGFSANIGAESSFNPDAVSPVGASGIAQIMPATAMQPGYGVPNIFDTARSIGIDVPPESENEATAIALTKNPDVGIRFGAAYKNAMLKLNGGNNDLANAAYNAGPGAVQSAGGVPNIPETQAYVQKLGGGPDEQIQPASNVEPVQSGPSMEQLLNAMNDPSFQHLPEFQQKMIVDMYQKQTTPPDPMKALQMEKLKAEIAKANSPDARAKLGLNPQYGVDAAGNPVLLQIGEDGSAVQTKMPDGVTLSKEPIRIDAGTHFVLLDPITRQPVGQIAKNVAGEAAATTTGKLTAEASVALPNAEAKGAEAVNMIEQLINHPALSMNVGAFEGRAPAMLQDLRDPRSADFRARLDQVKGQSFLTAFEALKGAGAITEQEGAAATKAMARLDQAQTEEDFRGALKDLQAITVKGIYNARVKAGKESPQAQQPAPAQDAPKRLKFNPATGELE